jgi:hypothetical protein
MSLDNFTNKIEHEYYQDFKSNWHIWTEGHTAHIGNVQLAISSCKNLQIKWLGLTKV